MIQVANFCLCNNNKCIDVCLLPLVAVVHKNYKLLEKGYHVN